MKYIHSYSTSYKDHNLFVTHIHLPNIFYGQEDVFALLEKRGWKILRHQIWGELNPIVIIEKTYPGGDPKQVDMEIKSLVRIFKARGLTNLSLSVKMCRDSTKELPANDVDLDAGESPIYTRSRNMIIVGIIGKSCVPVIETLVTRCNESYRSTALNEWKKRKDTGIYRNISGGEETIPQVLEGEILFGYRIATDLNPEANRLFFRIATELDYTTDKNLAQKTFNRELIPSLRNTPEISEIKILHELTHLNLV